MLFHVPFIICINCKNKIKILTFIRNHLMVSQHRIVQLYFVYGFESTLFTKMTNPPRNMFEMLFVRSYQCLCLLGSLQLHHCHWLHFGHWELEIHRILALTWKFIRIFNPFSNNLYEPVISISKPKNVFHLFIQVGDACSTATLVRADRAANTKVTLTSLCTGQVTSVMAWIHSVIHWNTSC